LRDAGEHTRPLVQHLLVPEANDADAARLQVLRPDRVLLLLLVVDLSIHLDGQLVCRGVEVEDEPVDRVLPAEPNTAELPLAQHLPEHRLRPGGRAAHLPRRPLHAVRRSPHPLPHPILLARVKFSPSPTLPRVSWAGG
jgi:hypothetical protein